MNITKIQQNIYEINQPISVDDILKLENTINLRIPKSYKLILFYSNGCRLKLNEVNFNTKVVCSIFNFFSLSDIKYAYECIEISYKDFDTDKKYLDYFLPIGDAGGSTYICIGLQEEFKDKIYHWDYQNYDWENPLSMYKLVSNSLEDLLENMVFEE